MPKPPTGNPRGRPKGTGRLTPAQTVEEAQTRVTVRLPTVLYDRLETFAAGRSYHRGSPQLARCVREALEEYLERHTNRQTGNNTAKLFDINRQTANESMVANVEAAETEQNNRQTVNVPASPKQGKRQNSQPVIKHGKPVTAPGEAPTTPRHNNRQTVKEVPAYDTSKHRLGKLCPRGHEWGTTGQSLRTNNRAGYCLACQAEFARDKRQAEKAGAAPVAPAPTPTTSVPAQRPRTRTPAAPVAVVMPAAKPKRPRR